MGVQLVDKANRVTASAFLAALVKAVPYTIHTVLTDNGIQFRLPPRYADGPTARLVTNMFDMRCRENDIEHRYTRVNHPCTNGQVERMSRTIKEATVRRNHYDSHAQLARHLNDFVDAYNFGRRLKTLKGLTPYEFICKAWTAHSQNDSPSTRSSKCRDRTPSPFDVFQRFSVVPHGFVRWNTDTGGERFCDRGFWWQWASCSH